MAYFFCFYLRVPQCLCYEAVGPCFTYYLRRRIIFYITFNRRVKAEEKLPPSPGCRQLAEGDRAEGWVKATGAWGRAGPPRVPACSCLGAREGFQGSLSAGSDAESPGESFLGFLLEELVVGDLKRRDAGPGGAALLLPTASQRSFSSSSPRPLSPVLGNTKSDLH